MTTLATAFYLPHSLLPDAALSAPFCLSSGTVSVYSVPIMIYTAAVPILITECKLKCVNARLTAAAATESE